MIIISGTNLSVEDLPLNEIMNYTIETTPQFLKIKLKTVATNPICLGVYLHESLQGQYELTQEVEDKLHYFSSDEQLFQLLENGGKIEEEPEVVEVAEQQPEEISYGSPQPAEQEVEQTTEPEPVELPTVEIGVTGLQIIETVDVEEIDPSEILLEIPDLEDKNAENQRVESLEKNLAQKDLQIAEHRKALEDIYKLQDIQLAEVKEVYEQQMSEMSKALEMANKKLESLAIPDEYLSIIKYASYMNNPRASLREGFSQQDLQSIGRLKSKMYIFAMGAGDSYYTFMKSFYSYLESNPNALVVDFTNDPFLSSKLRLQTKDTSIQLANPEVPLENLVKQYKSMGLIPSSFYNDISLLNFDWVGIIKRLQAYANGRPIIFLFNSISSFSVRYTVSKLATIGELSVFVKCNPVIINSLNVDLIFIPENRLKIVAMDYIDLVDSMLKRMSEKYKVQAFRTSTINWSKLMV